MKDFLINFFGMAIAMVLLAVVLTVPAYFFGGIGAFASVVFIVSLVFAIESTN